MGDAVVSLIAEELGAFIVREAKLLGGVREELEYIKDELRAMNSFIEMAEERRERDKGVRDWVKQVRELAYDVEDYIDEFQLQLIKPSDGHGGVLCCFSFISHLLDTLKARRWIAIEIQRVKSKAEEASVRAQRYGFVPGATNQGDDLSRSGSNSHPDPRLKALFVEEADLVGVDEPRDELVGWLLDDNELCRRVISVFGTSGLGKTTVVKRVYESPKLMNEEQFNCRAWITVTESFVWVEFLRQIHQQLFSSFPAEEELSVESTIIEKIRSHLKSKRYLIVFDDIWSSYAWEIIKVILPDNNNGSRVMVTTRNETVAYACCSPGDHRFVYKLKGLSVERSSDLFYRRVFGKTNCPPYLRELSDEILRKCDGLPLAIVTVGGLLASKPNKSREEWQKLLDHLGLELKGSVMNQILDLSYKDLPYQLKKCFLYLSIFPEDYEISGKLLQSLWIAEGFIRGDNGMTIEDVAETYFNELISRSMIQPVSISASKGTVKSIQLHDMMHEFITSESADLVSVLGKHSSTMSPDVIRRLSIFSSSNLEQILRAGENLNHARTLTIFRCEPCPSLIFSKLRFLRVLHLQSCYLDATQIFDICRLHHLKYLDMRETNIDAAKISLGELPNLEVLDLRNCRVGLEIPFLSKLQKLHYLRCNSISVPQGIGSLKALQTLVYFRVSFDEKQGAVDVKELGNLTQLRKLDVRGLTEKHGMDFTASLSKISNNLLSLRVSSRFDFYYSPLTFMHSVSSPPIFVQSLSLYG